MLFIFLICLPSAFSKEQSKILVKSYPIKLSELADKFTTIGQCRNEKSRSYYANSEGIVDYIANKEGQKVAEGELIIAINQKIANSTKEQALSNLAAIKAIYERNKTLLAKGFISAQGFETTKVDYEEAKLNLEKANQKFEDLMIKAAFPGVVGVIKVRVDDKIKIGDHLFDLTVSSDKTITVQLPENLYNSINIDNDITLSDSNNNKAQGKIIAISKNLSSNGTLEVRIKIAEDNNFIDGSYLHTEFTINKHNGLNIPESAVLRNEQGNFVYLIDNNNTIRQIYVQLGTRSDHSIEIISKDLKENDLVVLEGLTKVANGTLVEIQD